MSDFEAWVNFAQALAKALGRSAEMRRPADPLFGQMTIFGVTKVGELRLRESMRGGGR